MNYNEEYQRWVNCENLDPSLKAELASMNEKEKEDAFYMNLEFGTAGMRGILGAGTNRMNIYTIRKANVGFAKYVLGLPEGKERGVAIGYDNRHMSYKFAIESAKVLATYGIKSYIFESLRPTPELSYAVRYLKCAGGIMITASHNPKEYNGYKVYDDTGCQLIPEWGDQVVAYVNEVKDELAVEVISDEEAYPYITWIGEEVDEAYYQEVMAIEINPGMDKKDFKIVFSPQHGTSNLPVRNCLSRLGYNVIPVLAQCAPDPDFSNTKSPNPEVDCSYDLAIKKAKEVDADVVVICDPDGDRSGVVAKHDGEYVLMSGNQSAAVYLEYILKNYKDVSILPVGGCGNVIKLFYLLYSPLTEKTEIKSISGKILFLIDTDLYQQNVKTMIGLSSEKSQSIFLRRVQIKDDTIKLYDPCISNIYLQTEIEDCLDPECYYNAVMETIKESKETELKKIALNYEYIPGSKVSLLRGDNACIRATECKFISDKGKIISFAESTTNKYNIAKKYVEICLKKNPTHVLGEEIAKLLDLESI